MWSKNSLQELIQTRLRDHRFIVVANREPFMHRLVKGRVECVSAVSGMVSALDPIMRACGGTWIAHGSGNADRRASDARGYLSVPPDNPSYLLRRVWLTRYQEDGYYSGLSNEGLWPLCHTAFVRPIFNPKHWPIYRDVNALFARAVLEEAADGPAFVFIQDYHFSLLAHLLKEQNPNLIVAQFWHIPWPAPLAFQTFPWKEELLEGLLGNDLLGFQLRAHCQNFLDTVNQTVEAKVNTDEFEVVRSGKSTIIRPFPISIDVEEHESLAASAAVDKEMDRWRRELGLSDMLLGLGIDRIDYTKGIPERLRGVDRFLDKYSSYRQRFVLVQIGVPSRTHVRQYQILNDEIDSLVEQINWRWGTETWSPIIYLRQQYGPVQMMALHRLAHFCVVSSLDDGMNLVAKEFVASRTDDDGVLILSWFTGAARALKSAVLVNPFAVDEIADAMARALEMPREERRERIQKMRAAVSDNNVYRWAGKFLSALLKFEFPEPARSDWEIVSSVG